MKFYKTQDFKQTYKEWNQKLQASGFEDIENGEFVKKPNERTIASKNRDLILDFFLKLDSFITKNHIKPDHKKVLILYSKGICVKGEQGIAVLTEYSPCGAYKIINRYKKIILGQK